MAERLKRRLPPLSEVMRFAGPAVRGSEGGKWQQAQTVSDFRRLAMRRTPRAVFDYVEGAAGEELSRDRAVDAFNRVTFHPHVLRDVSSVDTTATILGRTASMPVVFGPTGFTRMMHRAGEGAVGRAAGRAGIPYVLSTLGTTSIEQLARDAPGAQLWFQLYVSKDRGRSRDLVSRAAESGYAALVVTVDVPVAGARHRDTRNGLTLPPTLSKRTLVGMARKPRWLFDSLTTDPLSFESLGAADDLGGLFKTVFDSSVTMRDLEWLRGEWSGPIVVKGVQRLDDAVEFTAAGVDGLAVSNHGGRQLDRAVSPLDLLPSVVEAVGDSVEVSLDGGVRSGADVAAAVALGATAAFVARPYLYALMAGGEPGVDCLVDRLHDDYVRTLQLLGVTAMQDLTSDLVTLERADVQTSG
jgi:L-lactate dehydrogenase (cytochrome)